MILQHKGANLAPWNIGNYEISVDGNMGGSSGSSVGGILESSTGLRVDEQPLIFYHFHGLKRITDWVYNPALAEYYVRPARLVRQALYEPYIEALYDSSLTLKSALELSRSPSYKRTHKSGDLRPNGVLPWRIALVLVGFVALVYGILTRRYLLMMNGHVT